MDSEFHRLLKPDGIGACPGCGVDVAFFIVWGKRMAECEPCQAAEKERRRFVRRKEDTLAGWLDTTPPAFQKTIEPYRIAPAIRPALDLDGMTGVGLAGTSGCGKTRVAYALLRMAAARGLMPYSVTAAEYRQAAANRHHNDPSVRGDAVATLRNAHNAQALLLDDIGKGATTATGDEALYDLLNDRRDNHRLTFWTANGGGEWLRKRFGPDMGPAILRRMVDVATPPGGKKQIFVCSEDGKEEG